MSGLEQRNRRDRRRYGTSGVEVCLGLLVLFAPILGGCASESTPPLAEARDTAPEPSELGERSDLSQAEADELANELLNAAYEGRIEGVRSALERGADPAMASDDGRTALMLAAFEGRSAIAGLLLESGARVEDRDPVGRTALMYAASGPAVETVELLLEAGADPLATDFGESFTALMFAAGEGHAPVVRALLKHGADPSMLDADGDTALDFAKLNGHTEVVELLSAGSE